MTITGATDGAARTWAARVAAVSLLLASLGAAGCGKGEPIALPGSDVTIRLSSPAFEDGETIPKPYTADGKDVSPPLKWAEPPEGTKSFALVCDDPDAPTGTFTHWLLWDLPPDRRELDEGVPSGETLPGGAKQGKNDQGKVGYGGPAPPAGKPHRYQFHLFALDAKLDLPAGAGRKQLADAMKGHVLAEGRLVGRYGR